MKEFKYNVMFLLKKRELYFSIVFVFLTNLIHVLLCIDNSFRFNTIIESSFSAEYQFILYNNNVQLSPLIIIVFPILFALAFADSTWIENKNKVSNILNMRLNPRKNFFVRFLISIFMTFIICFLSFLFNYILLNLIYGSGNSKSFFQDLPFDLIANKGWFLDDLRITNPVLFTIVINLTVSLTLGLFSGFAYVCSSFVKHRVIIYFIPLIFVVSFEMISNFIGLKEISFIKMLQPFSKYGLNHYFIGICFLLLLSLIMLIINCHKKDYLI